MLFFIDSERSKSSAYMRLFAESCLSFLIYLFLIYIVLSASLGILVGPSNDNLSSESVQLPLTSVTAASKTSQPLILFIAGVENVRYSYALC